MIGKPLEIFCGTGGVGKTTLATSRATFLADQGKKVLLITIDPAKRLKQVLNLEDKPDGEIQNVTLENFELSKEKSFDALILNPSSTLKRVSKKMGSYDDFDNHIVQILTRPYGGMNEIMAIVEVQFQLGEKNYDSIVLDTPPGKHFIDFLSATRKINSFFDSSFVEIFKFLGKSIQDNAPKKPQGFMKKIISSGVRKLLDYLEKVTGADFVEDFIDAIIGIYKNKQVFLQALQFEKELEQIEFSNWYLVTSVEQMKLHDAESLQKSAVKVMHSDNYLAINKCVSQYLDTWEVSKNSPLYRLKSSMLERENKLKETTSGDFKDRLLFPDVLSPTPSAQVSELSKSWKSF